ncbi:MAG: hypothetical protein QXP53_01800 [Candidatus Pacearchaeota archaeon]
MKNNFSVVGMLLLIVLLLALISGCMSSKEDDVFESEIKSILIEVFGNYNFQSSRTTFEGTEVNYSANYFSESYNRFLEIKPSLESALRKRGYVIESVVSTDEATISVGGKTITTPAQIQISSEKDNAKINFKIERTGNNKVTVIVAKKK